MDPVAEIPPESHWQKLADAGGINRQTDRPPPNSQTIHQASKKSHFQSTVNFLKTNPGTRECFSNSLHFATTLSRPLAYLISVSLIAAGGLIIAGSSGTASIVGLSLAVLGIMILAPTFCASIQNLLEPDSRQADGPHNEFAASPKTENSSAGTVNLSPRDSTRSCADNEDDLGSLQSNCSDNISAKIQPGDVSSIGNTENPDEVNQLKSRSDLSHVLEMDASFSITSA